MKTPDDFDSWAHVIAHVNEVEVERDRYRAALARIGSANSGVWGDIARAALYPERVLAEGAE